jgi:hypothetical protein
MDVVYVYSYFYCNLKKKKKKKIARLQPYDDPTLVIFNYFVFLITALHAN